MEIRTSQEKYLRAARLLTAAYLFVIFFALPLVFWQKFFDITEAKHAFFLGASLLYVLLLLLARLFFPRDFGTLPPRFTVHPAALAMAVLFLCFCVGSALGKYPLEAFAGQNNRYQGLLTLFVYAAVVFALSRQSIDAGLVESAIVLGAVPVSLLGVLNHFGVDPLGFYENLRAFDLPRFLSTLGNADFYGSYICIAFAAAVGLFIRAEKKGARVLSALALVAISFGALVAGSDSTALGLIAAALLFPLALFSDARALRRLILAAGIFSLCALGFGLLSGVLSSTTYLSAFVTLLKHPAVSGALCAVFALLWLMLHKTDPTQLRALFKPYLILLASATLVGIVALVLLNTALSQISLGGAERYLRFSESWGTDRGKIWLFAARLYRSYSPAQMLFGAGPSALFHADAAARVFSDAALDTAHNEYLQYLLVSGAAGLLAYLAALGFAIYAGIRKCAKNPAVRGLLLALIAYAAQATVNIAQPASTPLLFLLIGVLISTAPAQSEETHADFADNLSPVSAPSKANTEAESQP